MPTPTYTPLANITLGSDQVGVSFTSISAIYRDLVLIVSGKPTATNSSNVSVRFNSNATSGAYSRVGIVGDGSGYYSAASSTGTYMTFNQSIGGGVIGNVILNIMDYSATDKHKNVLARINNSAGGVEANAARWANTSAINSIFITLGDPFVAGSTLALYGIAA